MEQIFNDDIIRQLKSIFSSLESPVQIVLFIKKDCKTCSEQLKLLQGLVSLSDKLNLKVYDIILHGDQSSNYRINKTPATLVINKKDSGIRFYGLTSGQEFQSLINSIFMISNHKSGLDPQFETLIKKIDKPVHIQVFTTLTCPFCPRMVHLANQFAFINNNIHTDTIEIAEFPEYIKKYNVDTVPKTIINEKNNIIGVIPPETLYLEIIKVIDPIEYKKIYELYEAYQASKRNVKKVEPNQTYDVLIIGGGPAGMSASVYAYRKGLKVGIITKKMGGQMGYTGEIDNYLGLPDFGGSEMVDLFRSHIEKYSISELNDVFVTSITKKSDVFIVKCDNDQSYQASSIIYATGKEYKKLGIPGEENFIGKGISFCAICDAPLYQDQKVAVIGGGNSAFTAVRDLTAFASEIHVLYHGDKFTADDSLINLATKAENVKIHKSVEVLRFIGGERLTKLLLKPVGEGEPYELSVEGAFIEIGLIPNSSIIKQLIQLNNKSEVIVNRDQSTTVEGLFAAGDVTDVPEKQISIAVGQGALAAISVYNYLVTTKQIKLGEKKTDWQ